MQPELKGMYFLFQGDGRISPFVSHRPQIDGADRSTIFEVTRAAIRKGEMRPAVIA